MRKITPELKAWFNTRLIPAIGPVPWPFIAPFDPTKMLLLTAISCVGITETGGDNAGEMVERFQSTIGRHEREPWCMAFIQSCVAYVETFGFTSGLFASEHCLITWTNSTCRRPIEPAPGDLVVYRQGDTTRGHVELITSTQGKTFNTVAGNTGPGANVERNGDGVYLKTRPRGGVGKMIEVGFLRVF